MRIKLHGWQLLCNRHVSSSEVLSVASSTADERCEFGVRRVDYCCRQSSALSKFWELQRRMSIDDEVGDLIALPLITLLRVYLDDLDSG